VPNPVTWSVMKLISTRDRHEKSEDADRDEPYRNFHHHEAMKHARDVARVIAMMTRDERERALEVISEIGRALTLRKLSQRAISCFFGKTAGPDRSPLGIGGRTTSG
jgi:hypothetical protein